MAVDDLLDHAGGGGLPIERGRPPRATAPRFFVGGLGRPRREPEPRPTALEPDDAQLAREARLPWEQPAVGFQQDQYAHAEPPSGLPQDRLVRADAEPVLARREQVTAIDDPVARHQVRAVLWRP